MGALEALPLVLKVVGGAAVLAGILGSVVFIWRRIERGATDHLKVEQLQDSARRREDQDEAQQKAHDEFWEDMKR